MKFPHSEFRGEENGLVQHIDIAPTLLEFAKCPIGNSLFQGKSLLPLLRDHLEINDFVFSQVQLSEMYPSVVGGRTNEYKYMEVRRPEVTLRKWLKEWNKLWPSRWHVYKPVFLFGLKEDPSEKANILGQNKEITRALHSRVRSITKESDRIARFLKRRKSKKGKEPIDRDVAEQLQALGYFD